MLALLDTALTDQAYSAVDSIFNAEGDLIETLAEPLDQQLPDILARFLVSRDPTELNAAAVRLLTVDFAKTAVGSFFQSFAAADAFLEFRDLETYASTAEGMQLYLYIGTLKYGSAIYPLLYLPLDARRNDENGSYSIKLSNQLYANKRAVDFILQELRSRQSRQWLSPIEERITYLTGSDGISSTVEVLLGSIARAFGFTDTLRLGPGPVHQQSDSQVSLSTGLYFCAFEKADEALLNDYEEMISQIHTNKQGVVGLFQSIVEGVIMHNPRSIDQAVDDKWNDIPVDLRAVPDTPIPLNEEQQKVLQAIHHEEGRIIVVEGPPGTGKSHTIVAIAADCAFNKKSCLILSDKPEALEVVHNKLSAAMNEVRGSDEFPNPLLRLGTEQTNFRKLTSAATLAQVSAQVKATKANRGNLEADRDQRRQALRDQIGSVISTYGAIKTSDIRSIEALAQKIDGTCGGALSMVIDDACEAHPEWSPGQPPASAPVQALMSQLLQQIPQCTRASLDSLAAHYRFAETLSHDMQTNALQLCPALQESHLPALTQVIHEVQSLKRPLIGYLLRGARLQAVAAKCQAITPFGKSLEFPDDLADVQAVVSAGYKLTAAIASHTRESVEFALAYGIVAKNAFPLNGLNAISAFVDVLKVARDDSAIKHLYMTGSVAERAQLWAFAIDYACRRQLLTQQFAQAPHIEYVARKTEIERLNTALMNAEVDSRLVHFMENSRADARVLATLIKEKKKFPEEKFETVKQAFPVMIASIREFGEYMPLKENLLDVLVIDEASQVSVAQAFPAMLRAKKIVVMGDTNQFANTKSSNASIELNQKHRSELEAFFKREVSDDVERLERLSYFDVKRSVLDFCQLCANYRIMLRKHFRSYKELINYSSTTFYRGALQAIKIRTIPLADCIEFNVVDPGAPGAARNTNPAEADWILKRCLELLEEEAPPTVGIITPFREQQSLLSRLFANDGRAADFRRLLKIKVMTFDSCQGEERGMIFYSMVATRSQDLLNYIFPVALENPDELVGEKLKMQRLNVGFSRAQEVVSFVISKPVAEFKGSIGQALRHFENIAKTPTASADSTDPSSPMESKVLDWFYATPFYQLRTDTVEIMPQFPLGEYLRQLDPHYKHPSWRVDFLVTIDTGSSLLHVVIEYDGFEHHFRRGAPVNVDNHERYLNEADVERQLTLESYGYRFLRLNRFNVGRDPVGTLSARLDAMTESATRTDSTGAVRRISEQADALADRTAKSCERCEKIKPIAMFFDRSLGGGAGGVGRVCMQCKQPQGQGHRTRARAAGGPRRRRWR
jgi:very-short-patch-repair endonuclease